MVDCSKTTEIDIIKLINSWDIDAYFCIVEKYKEKLLNYILRITNIDLSEWENLLQEAFIKAYQNINSYNPDYSFSNWLYKITHNLVIDYHRKNKDSQTISLETQDEEYKKLIEIIPSNENIKENIIKKELILKIREILNLLELKYKEVLILKYIEEKNYEEISDILKTPAWTVATLINRGKKAFIQKALENNINSYM